MGFRVLLVENDTSVANALQEALEAAGYKVSIVPRGDEGFVRAREETFEIVIADLRLPGLSGLELVRELHVVKPRLPIILMAAYGTTESVIEATKNGAFEYVTKPFEMRALLRIVEKAAACQRQIRYCGQQSRDAKAVQGNWSCGQKFSKCFDLRRNGVGQGTGGARASQLQQPRQRTLRRSQLHCNSRHPP
jgi:DNA-binding NtrC family response regulator